MQTIVDPSTWIISMQLRLHSIFTTVSAVDCTEHCVIVLTGEPKTLFCGLGWLDFACLQWLQHINLFIEMGLQTLLAFSKYLQCHQSPGSQWNNTMSLVPKITQNMLSEALFGHKFFHLYYEGTYFDCRLSLFYLSHSV